MKADWQSDVRKEFRVVHTDGSVEEIPQYELRARFEMLSSAEERKPLADLFLGEIDEAYSPNGDRYSRIRV